MSCYNICISIQSLTLKWQSHDSQLLTGCDNSRSHLTAKCVLCTVGSIHYKPPHLIYTNSAWAYRCEIMVWKNASIVVKCEHPTTCRDVLKWNIQSCFIIVFNGTKQCNRFQHLWLIGICYILPSDTQINFNRWHGSSFQHCQCLIVHEVCSLSKRSQISSSFSFIHWWKSECRVCILHFYFRFKSATN